MNQAHRAMNGYANAYTNYFKVHSDSSSSNSENENEVIQEEYPLHSIHFPPENKPKINWFKRIFFCCV